MSWRNAHFPKTGHVIMHTILLCSLTQFPPITTNDTADLSQRQIGTLGRHVGASHAKIADYQ